MLGYHRPGYWKEGGWSRTEIQLNRLAFTSCSPRSTRPSPTPSVVLKMMSAPSKGRAVEDNLVCSSLSVVGPHCLLCIRLVNFQTRDCIVYGCQFKVRSLSSSSTEAEDLQDDIHQFGGRDVSH